MRERFETKRIPGRTTIASALFAKQDGRECKAKQKSCVFCSGSHEEKGCSETTAAGRKILFRQGRCLLCLKREHKSYECRTKGLCSVYRHRHHVSICNNSLPPQEDVSAQSNASDIPSSTANTTSCLSDIEYGGRAVLQTVLAVVKEADRKVEAHTYFSIQAAICHPSG